MIDLKDMRRRSNGEPSDQGSYGPTLATPSEVIKLLDMLEEDQKDAARYQWIRSMHNNMLSDTGVVRYNDLGHCRPIESFTDTPLYDLDLAIDAAMKEKD